MVWMERAAGYYMDLWIYLDKWTPAQCKWLQRMGQLASWEFKRMVRTRGR